MTCVQWYLYTSHNIHLFCSFGNHVALGIYILNLDSKVQGANMGFTWVLLAPDGPHVGPPPPLNLALRESCIIGVPSILCKCHSYSFHFQFSPTVMFSLYHRDALSCAACLHNAHQTSLQSHPYNLLYAIVDHPSWHNGISLPPWALWELQTTLPVISNVQSYMSTCHLMRYICSPKSWNI